MFLEMTPKNEKDHSHVFVVAVPQLTHQGLQATINTDKSSLCIYGLLTQNKWLEQLYDSVSDPLCLSGVVSKG